jgi:hypothetical protein
MLAGRQMIQIASNGAPIEVELNAMLLCRSRRRFSRTVFRVKLTTLSGAAAYHFRIGGVRRCAFPTSLR